MVIPQRDITIAKRSVAGADKLPGARNGGEGKSPCCTRQLIARDGNER